MVLTIEVRHLREAVVQAAIPDQVGVAQVIHVRVQALRAEAQGVHRIHPHPRADLVLHDHQARDDNKLKYNT